MANQSRVYVWVGLGAVLAVVTGLAVVGAVAILSWTRSTTEDTGHEVAASATSNPPVDTPANTPPPSPPDAAPQQQNVVRRESDPAPRNASQSTLPPWENDEPTLTRGEPPIKYAWKIGTEYSCFFRVETTVGELTQMTSGLATYKPTAVDPVTIVEQAIVKEGSGTAFAVHPEGVLVTCAHVVEDATTVIAHVAGKEYPAKVIALDFKHDLALLRIEVDRMPHLCLDDSDRVELAQDVRVVGYPLSDVLGESVKVSRGTVSGMVTREEGKLFQIDASVNPGNSGGPLVEAQGGVVGIASELLTGASIDSVGFAIPSNDALALLRQKKIPTISPGDAVDLSGPELARRVTPAVALLKVVCGGSGSAAAERKVIDFVAVLATEPLSSRPGSRGFPRMSSSLGSGRTQSETGRLVVDSHGKVAMHEGKLAFPFIFDLVGKVGIETLPDDDRDAWETYRLTMVPDVKTEAVQSSRNSGFGSSGYPGSRMYPGLPSYRPPMPGRSPYLRRRSYPYPDLMDPYPDFMEPEPEVKLTVTWLPAAEKIEYRLGDESAEGTLEIIKNYELITLHDEGDPVYLELKGSGTITWDKKLGMPRKMEFKAKANLTKEQITLRLPVTMTYRFEEKKKGDKPAAAKTTPPAVSKSESTASKPKQQPPPKPEPEPKPEPVRKLADPLSAEELSKLRDADEKTSSAGGLSKFRPDE